MSNVKNYDLIIVDFNNLYFRTATIPYNDFEEYTQMQREDNIHNCLKTLDALSETFSKEGFPAKMVVVSDVKIMEEQENISSRAKRQQISAEYKAHRKTKRPEIYEDLKVLIEQMKTYRDDLHLISVPQFEADDLVYPILELFPDKRAVLVSNDEDWCVNLVENKVDVYKGAIKNFSPYMPIEITTFQSYKQEKGFSPDTGLIIYKMIRGDTSDNIAKGVLRLPIKVVIELANCCSCTDDILQKAKDNADFIPPQWREKIIENEAQLRLNEALVRRIPLDQDILANTYSCMRG